MTPLRREMVDDVCSYCYRWQFAVPNVSRAVGALCHFHSCPQEVEAVWSGYVLQEAFQWV